MVSEYVFLDENNIVVDGISGIDFDDTSNLADGFSSWEEFYGNHKGLTCKRTDVKTQSNQHEDGGTPFRGNYAGVGYIYDESNDVFYPAKPFDSWTLDTDDWNWKPPTPHPNTLDSSDTHPYTWDEDTQEWVE